MPPVSFGDLNYETYGTMLFAPMESNTENACFVKLDSIVSILDETRCGVDFNAVNAETGELVLFDDEDLIEVIDQAEVHDYVIGM